MNCVVQYLLRSLHNFLLTGGYLVVEISRSLNARHFCNGVNGDSPGGHGKDPVIDRKFVLVLLEELLELFRLLGVGVQPSLVLDLDDSSEALVLGEGSIDTFKVPLVMLEDFNETIHAELVPPASLLEQCEATPEDVPHVATASDIRRQRAV